MDYLAGQNTLLLAVSLFWGLPWKGFALWRAAKLDHKKWFIALLVLNTMAVVDIVYLLRYNKRKEEATFLADFIKERLHKLDRFQK